MPERITFTADNGIFNQIIEGFGKDVQMPKKDEDYVEVTVPKSLRERIRALLDKGRAKYK